MPRPVLLSAAEVEKMFVNLGRVFKELSSIVITYNLETIINSPALAPNVAAWRDAGTEGQREGGGEGGRQGGGREGGRNGWTEGQFERARLFFCTEVAAWGKQLAFPTITKKLGFRRWV